MATLKGKTAIVTGSSRGIGRAIALRLARDGARVVMCARTASDLSDAVNEITAAGGVASSLALDLREPEAGAGVVDAALKAGGTLDIVVNNAGATRRGEFVKLTDEDWADSFALKFFGAVRVSRASWTHLQKSKGSLLFIS